MCAANTRVVIGHWCRRVRLIPEGQNSRNQTYLINFWKNNMLGSRPSIKGHIQYDPCYHYWHRRIYLYVCLELIAFQ